jgi:hypothetical protein
MTGRRVRRILEGLPPLFGVGVIGVELDDSEKVFSRRPNPRFRDEATRLESFRFIA